MEGVGGGGRGGGGGGGGRGAGEGGVLPQLTALTGHAALRLLRWINQDHCATIIIDSQLLYNINQCHSSVVG